MYLIELGRKGISLEHMVCWEEADPASETNVVPPKVLRVWMEAGRVFDFEGEPADRLRRHLAAAAVPLPAAPAPEAAPAPRPPSVGHSVDPGGSPGEAAEGV